MDYDTKERLRKVMTNSRFGRPNTPEDEDFAYACWKKWPEAYGELHAGVVDDSIAAVNPAYIPKSQRKDPSP